jgi:nicotinate-nucleotide adenylyltransferase
MKTRKRIIIYGGSFDPPHRGHFALIRAALETLTPAALYIVPGFRSPFKETPGAPYADRAGMLRAGLKSEGLRKGTRVSVHHYEFERGRLTYTWRTVSFFRKKHPGAELYFLMGSDCLETFHRWKHYRRILAAVRLVVGARDGFEFKNPCGLPFIRLKGRFPLLSSTGLKAGLFSGQAQPDLCKRVAGYIALKGLYLAGLRRRAAALMTAERFSHSASVTRLALDLALKYGADPERAAVAGMLHDIARDRGPRRLAAYARGNRLKVPALKETLRRAPVIIHSYAGAGIAKKNFGVRDRETLNAIRHHTLGSTAPGLLEKIIYVADLAAGGRAFSEAGLVRKLAFIDLDAAYAAANYVKLVYAFRVGGWLHPESIKTWNSLPEKYK